MKLQTNNMTEGEVRACLDRAKADGLITADVVFDIFGTVGSRSFRYAYEVHLASADRDSRQDDIKRKVSSTAGGGGLKYAATYDEWGWFLAEFFAADEDARSDRYRNKDDFHAKTEYAYATRDELPPDEATRAAEQEPEPEYASTRPESGAMLGPDETVARIDDVLSYWQPNHP